MEKTNSKGKIIALILSIVLIVSALVVCLIIIFPKGESKAKAVMECSVNPDVQFVLDTNDRVLQVNFLNEDAEVLLNGVDFKGKTAEEAGKYFVQLCTEAGYINANTTGHRVDITFSCENPSEFEQIQQKVVKSINKYFDDNGIIAGAVASINTSFNDALTKLGVSASEFNNLTNEEKLALIKSKSEELKDVAVSLRDDINTYIEQLKNSDAFKRIPTLEESIAELENQINSSSLDTNTKNLLIQQLNSIKSQLKQLQDQLKQQIDAKMNDLKQQSKAIFNSAKQVLQQRKNEAKQILEQHKQQFEANSETIKSQIEAYRNSLK